MDVAAFLTKVLREGWESSGRFFRVRPWYVVGREKWVLKRLRPIIYSN